MTPERLHRVPRALGQSSGFQSFQYRQIEFMLGNRNRAMLRPHAHRPEVLALLEAELAPTEPLRRGAAARCARAGSPCRRRCSSATSRRAHTASPTAWSRRGAQVYAEPERWWSLYELAEKLVDLEDYFRRWRFNHVTTVERVIGFKRGTGGTGGVSYLKRMLEVELFPELWQVRTVL